MTTATRRMPVTGSPRDRRMDIRSPPLLARTMWAWCLTGDVRSPKERQTLVRLGEGTMVLSTDVQALGKELGFGERMTLWDEAGVEEVVRQLDALRSQESPVHAVAG